MMRKHIVILSLIVYIAVFFSMAVVFRESSDMCIIRLDLFNDILNPDPDGYRDVILNIVCFIPVGLLVGLLLEKYRWVNALLAGLLVSLTIEFSQLIWHRGVFDVNDLFNNALGAVIGGGDYSGSNENMGGFFSKRSKRICSFLLTAEEKEPKKTLFVHFFGAKKRNQRNIVCPFLGARKERKEHPPNPSPS